MEIIWLGHACFALESAGYRVVIDPYYMETYPPLRTEGDLVLCSHGHADHSNEAAVALRNSGKENPFTIEKVATFHDSEGGKLRGSNTMHVLRAEGLTVVHCGDLGHWPNDEQLAAISGADCLLIPVGGFFTIGPTEAKQVLNQLQPRVAVPMHYRRGGMGYEVLSTLEDFTGQYEAWTEIRGNVLDIRPETSGLYVLDL